MNLKRFLTLILILIVAQQSYEKTFLKSEPIEISVDCFP